VTATGEIDAPLEQPTALEARPLPPPASAHRRHALAGWLWPAAVFAVGLALSFCYYHRAWAHPSESWAGGQGDPEQQMWFLRWCVFALSHANNPLLTNYLQYPAGTNLMWNTSDIAPGLLLSPVTLTWGPVVSYNLLMLLVPPTTALTAYAAFRRWASRLGAALGGLLLGFCPFILGQSLGHLHVTLLPLLPLTLLLLDEILVRQSWRWWISGATLGLVAAAQLLTSEEILTSEAIFAVVGVLVLVMLHRRRVREKLGYAVRAAVVAVGVFLALAAYPLYVQFAASNKISKPIHGDGIYITDLLNPLLPVNQKFRPEWVLDYVDKFSGNNSEWTGYIGVPLAVILIALVVARWRTPVVMFSALMGTVALVLSLGPRLHIAGHQYPVPLPWAAFNRVPVLHQILPARLSVIVTLFVAMGLAVAVTEIVRSRKRWLHGVGALALVFAAVSWVPRLLPTTQVPAPAYFTSSAVKQIPQGSVALVLPYVSQPEQQHAMLWQAEAGMRFRMPEGWAIVPRNHAGLPSQTRTTYSSLTPTTTHIPEPDAARIRAELREWDVQTVIIGPFLNDKPGTRESAIDVTEQILGRSPVEEDGVQVWYGIEN
jgi:hypothetical protein